MFSIKKRKIDCDLQTYLYFLKGGIRLRNPTVKPSELLRKRQPIYEMAYFF